MSERTISAGSAAYSELHSALEDFAAERLGVAAERLRRLSSQYPDDPEAVGRLGYAECSLGNHEKARVLLTRAMELDPARELWSMGLFHCLWETGDTLAAFAELRRFLSIYPDAYEHRQLIREMHEEFEQKGWLREG